MSDDETINPDNLTSDERSQRLPGNTTGPYLTGGNNNFGSSGDKTSVDSELIGQVRKYLPGDIIDGVYQLTSVVGRGGMGVVFACTHLVMGNQYAIKLLSGDSLSNEHWTRFQAEAKALAKLNHSGIVSVYNMGIDAGTCPYYVMDLLSGEALDALISRSGPLPVDQALDIFIQVADALTCAHVQGIIHRDIKPSNMMLIKDHRNKFGTVKIVDFGIARLSKQSMGAQSQTATGLIFGTPFYMSPEQCQGLRVDERSDIYSFGCALFEALTGTPPFRGENAFQTFLMHQTETPPRLADRAQQANFSKSLELAMDKMLRKKPADRYQKMDQIKRDLERIRAGKEILPLSATNPQSSTMYPAPVEKQYQPALQVAEDPPAKESGQTSPWSLRKKVLLFSPLPVLSAALILWFFLQSHNAAPVKTTTAAFEDDTFDIISPEKSMRKIGCSEEEIAMVNNYSFGRASRRQEDVKKTFKLYLADAIKKDYRLINKEHTAITFPQDMIIGAIGFGDNKPLLATDKVKIPTGLEIAFYQNYCLREFPQFVQLFGPEDLSTLELDLSTPCEAIKTLKTWKNLKTLSFFNSLTKPLPNFDQYDQSQLSNRDLDALDQFNGLETIGLCGSGIDSAKLAQLGLLRRVTGLRLKKIVEIETLLKVLPALDNLKELWLVSEETTDEHLEYIAQMKNLETLRIRRSALTPKSLEVFRRMKLLKHLYLDRNWSAEDKAQFKAALPFVQFESIMDTTYWPVIPGTDDRNSTKWK